MACTGGLTQSTFPCSKTTIFTDVKVVGHAINVFVCGFVLRIALLTLRKSGHSADPKHTCSRLGPCPRSQAATASCSPAPC